ncbi:MAG: type II toxin-antitoxin system VapC family toxin [Thermomicrobiales bacterium]
MKYLLDSHTLIWFAAEDAKLSPAAMEVIARDPTATYVSIASLWEIGIKLSTGKLELAGGLESLLDGMARNRLELLAISSSHVVKISQLPYHHRDPFDRMIAAQALVDDLVVISADPALDAYGVRRLW